MVKITTVSVAQSAREAHLRLMFVCVSRVKGRVVPNQARFFLSPTVSDDSEEWACEDETVSFCNESVRLTVCFQTGRSVTSS